MKRIIFTLYYNLELEYVQEIKNFNNISEYYDLLIQNKKEYAESINVDFVCHNDINEIEKLCDDDPFVNVNLLKHKFFAKYAEEYDEVMYVDIDVVFNTEENIFKEIDLSKGIAVKDQNDEIKTKIKDDLDLWELGRKNPTVKYFITKDLLKGKKCNVINTGIMIAKSEHIRQLKIEERLPTINDLIKNMNNDYSYSNNESIFSYIIEKYKIPYQLLQDEWHDIRDYRIKNKALGKVIHFINKRFDHFFNNKEKVIYSLYIKIPDKKLDKEGYYPGDNLTKSIRTKNELSIFEDQLIKNKQEYANYCKADFFVYGNDNQYKEFAKKYSFLSEYNIINLYKIFLMEKLAKEYDHVLYLDFDTLIHEKINFFHNHSLDNFIYCQYNIVDSVDFIDTNVDHMDYRSPFIKYWNSRALLEEESDMEIPSLAFNTGVVGISKKMLDQLQFFDGIDKILSKMKDIKEDPYSMYPPRMRESFGYDNEAIFGYKIFKNDVDYKTLNNRWHYRFDEFNPTIEKFNKKKPIIIHFINKKIKWYLEHKKDVTI